VVARRRFHLHELASSVGILVIGLLIGGLTAGGCAGKRPPVASVSAAAADSQSRRPARLAWLPVEGFADPQVATALNQRLEAARIADVDQHVRAPVSMEVAQLSIECIETVPRCYQAVGKHLQADRLLWAELVRSGRRGSALKAVVMLFDVGRGVEVHRVQRDFAGPDAALAGFESLVNETVAAGAGRGVAATRTSLPP
jgi:hypothetical protein